MPEGHTIHRIARDQEKWFLGQKLAVLSPQGRFSKEATALDGKKLLSIAAHGKHLFYTWSKNTRVHVHLGLYGKFRVHKNPAPDPRGAVRMRVIGKDRTFDLNGPSACEIVSEDECEKIFARLGPDPLRQDADREVVWKRISKSRSTLGQLLLNQSVIAGVGNVYRAEILFLLSIHPERKGNELTREEFEAMWELTVQLLKMGVKYNRIITVDCHKIGKPNSKLNRDERLNIYKKPICPRCNDEVYCWELGARTIYACESCQV